MQIHPPSVLRSVPAFAATHVPVAATSPFSAQILAPAKHVAPTAAVNANATAARSRVVPASKGPNSIAQTFRNEDIAAAAHSTLRPGGDWSSGSSSRLSPAARSFNGAAVLCAASAGGGGQSQDDELSSSRGGGDGSDSSSSSSSSSSSDSSQAREQLKDESAHESSSGAGDTDSTDANLGKVDGETSEPSSPSASASATAAEASSSSSSGEEGGAAGAAAAAATGATGPGEERQGVDEDCDGDLTSTLGDWREFRARLVRSGLQQQEQQQQRQVSGSSPSSASALSSGLASGEDNATAAEDLDRPLQVLSSSASASVADPVGGGSWAHPIATPEAGCLVIAHPAAFGMSQQYFHQAVIFLFAHGPDGTAGVILNRPSQYTLSQLAGFEELLPEFAASPLYIGGDVGPTATHCIHGVADLARDHGAKEVCRGVYVGGYSGAKEHVRQGKSSAMDYRWFARYAGWAPGQLEREVKAGVWYLAASSPDLVLKQTLNLDKPLWTEVMELIGR